MILKICYSEKVDGVFCDACDIVDGIKMAKVYARPDHSCPMVMCHFANDSIVTIDIENVAFLMNDNGKTVETIRNMCNDDDSHETLLDAIEAAQEKSLKA